MKYRIYGRRRRDTHLVVTAERPRKAIRRAIEMFPRFLVGPGPWKARPFRKEEAQIDRVG